MTNPSDSDAASLWRDDPVPQSWQGLWRRLALERADGTDDTTARVLWLQTAHLYVDLRQPAGRPDFTGVTGFADLTPEMRRYLASQGGFAGTLRWRGDDAHWQRRIDFSPPAGPPDEGTLVRDRRMMTEHGIHHAYVEHWWDDAPGAPLAVVLDAPRHIVVRAGDAFLSAEERRPVPPPPGTLVASVEAGADPAALLDCEISLGRIADGRWLILHSTLPWREGCTLSNPAATR
ncbi:hypothetical protein [Acuticoccus mangrovi]|uniref:Uncharacterized protein n=1 Tax=Acuticoccus mangrovi TaxID=2796142 RepID=A0A934MJ49_9HYPH|nr:hypothetical protein [Acuticoccus mangrovi]MBJ3777896.1 hypothetical protein [Acuticoccus mangrovi]